LFGNLQILSIAVDMVKILSEEKLKKIQNLSAVLVFRWYKIVNQIK